MSRPLLLFLASLSAAVPAFASKHTWLGTSTNRFSDAANWSGGSPVDDSDAELVFDHDAARFYVVNDIPGFRFKRLSILYQGYTIAGAPMQTTDGSIFNTNDSRVLCDLTIEGTLTISGGASATGLELAGAISGSGGIEIVNGTVRFTGL